MRLREAFLAAIAVLCVSTQSAGAEARRGRFTAKFTEKGPRTDLAAIAKAIERGDPGPTEYDIAAESFEVYVPEGYDPDSPMGLLVWTDSGDGGGPPQDWLPVLKANDLIFVGGNMSGNTRGIPRYALALDAVHNMTKLYTIDSDRIYTAGVSGGGRIASRLALVYGDVFDGGMYVVGCDYIKFYQPPGDYSYWTFPAPPGPILDGCKQNNRYVFVTGERDYNRDQIMTVHQKGYGGDGFKYTTYLEVPGMGHGNINGEWFQKAVTALDKPLEEAALATYARAVSLEKRGRLSDAMTAFARAASRLREAEEGRVARERLAALKTALAADLASASQAVAAKEYERAASLLRPLVERYGPARAAEAAVLLKRIETDPAIRTEIAAARVRTETAKREAAAAGALNDARQLAATDFVKGYAQLRAIEERYAGTAAAAEASADAERIWADPDKRRAVQASSSSDEANRHMRRARNYATNGMTDQARAELNKIIRQFPNTDVAREAQALLRELR